MEKKLVIEPRQIVYNGYTKEDVLKLQAEYESQIANMKKYFGSEMANMKSYYEGTFQNEVAKWRQLYLDESDKQNKIDKPFNNETFYDMVINTHSMRQFGNGCEVLFPSKNGEQRYEEFKKENLCVVGVVGNFNKGKSFIIGELANSPIPKGHSVHTLGISIKFPTEDAKMIFMDSAGFETALKFDTQMVDGVEDTPKSGKFNVNFDMLEATKDREHTEDFMHEYILDNSNIILIVVEILTYADQKLIHRLKGYLNSHKTIILVHNLIHFSRVKEVEDYISNSLSRSFHLEQTEMTKFGESDSSKNNICWVEQIKESEASIVHYILARKGTVAGDYYNEKSIEAIINQINSFKVLKKFDPIQKVLDHLDKKIHNIFEQPGKISYEDKIIRIGNVANDKLKKRIVDEMGFSVRVDGKSDLYYIPDNTMVLVLEAPNIEEESIVVDPRIEHSDYVLKFTAKRKPIKFSKTFKTYYSKIDVDDYTYETRLPISEFDIDFNSYQPTYEAGLIYASFNLRGQLKPLKNPKIQK